MIETRVKALIKEKGLLQKTLAKKAGFTERQMSRLLHGLKPISDNDVLTIANALGVTPNDLYETADFVKEQSRQAVIKVVCGDKTVYESPPVNLDLL